MTVDLTYSRWDAIKIFAVAAACIGSTWIWNHWTLTLATFLALAVLGGSTLIVLLVVSLCTPADKPKVLKLSYNPEKHLPVWLDFTLYAVIVGLVSFSPHLSLKPIALFTALFIAASDIYLSILASKHRKA